MALTSTSFTEGHKHSAKPRKRTALSEEILRDYIYTDGRDALDRIKKEFKSKKPEIRLGALSLFTKLVFITSPSSEEEKEQNQSVMLFVSQLLEGIAEAQKQGKIIDSAAIKALVDIVGTIASKSSGLTQSIQNDNGQNDEQKS